MKFDAPTSTELEENRRYAWHFLVGWTRYGDDLDGIANQRFVRRFVKGIERGESLDVATKNAKEEFRKAPFACPQPRLQKEEANPNDE